MIRRLREEDDWTQCKLLCQVQLRERLEAHFHGDVLSLTCQLLWGDCPKNGLFLLSSYRNWEIVSLLNVLFNSTDYIDSYVR